MAIFNVASAYWQCAEVFNANELSSSIVPMGVPIPGDAIEQRLNLN